MILKIKYRETGSFQKQFKKPKKKFRTLDDDLTVVKKNVIELYHLKKIDNRSTFPIPGFCSPEILVCKIKKFACKSLKGRGNQTGLRVIYAYHNQTQEVHFIEIYFKADQVNEDQNKLKNYLQSIN